MKNIIIYLFIIKLKTIISIIPLWNFTSSTIDLLSTENSYTYTIYTKTLDSINIKLQKTISKSENSITEQNSIFIGSYENIVEWDDIESSYIYNGNIYICPRGKFHVYKFNTNLFELKPPSFSYSGDWDLKCYNQAELGILFVAYTNNYNKFCGYYYNREEWNEDTTILNGLYDFKWTTTTTEQYTYPMISLVLDGNYINLRAMKFKIEGTNINRPDAGSKGISNILSYSKAYFNKNNYNFYYITYDDFNFYSGYNNINDIFDYTSVESISVSKNNESPLDFDYNFTIKQINFLNNTQYVFYEIYNNEKNKTYHGIIDIILNKVIFNTDENIISFKPLTSNSMLAITNNSAYQICLIADNKKCIESCQTDNLFIDSQGPNFCGKNCSNYILVPNEICINECDDNFFYSNDSYHCGFCIYTNQTHPYKLLNTSGCLNLIPDDTYLFNEKKYLLKPKLPETTTITVSEIPTITTITIPKIPCNKNEGLYPFNYFINDIKTYKCFKKNEKYFFF